MSQKTFIKQDDIVSTLQSYQLVQYWKGQVSSCMLVFAHFVVCSVVYLWLQYIVNPNSRLLEEHAKQIQAAVAKRLIKFKPDCLKYTPRVWEVRCSRPLLPAYDVRLRCLDTQLPNYDDDDDDD